MILSKSLGMIPSWQINQSWAQNPNFNNHVTFPTGWNQLTPQPVGPNYGPPPEAGMNGLGHAVMRRAYWRSRGVSGLGAFVMDNQTKFAVGGLALAMVASLGALAMTFRKKKR